MSDIRFNQWLHNSGTGGVSQVDGGHVGIGTTNPLIPVGAGVTAILNVGVVTANSFYGDGSNLSGVQVGGASSLSFNDNIGAYWGNSQDLKIYHDGNHSYIDDQGTGNLRLRSGTLEILNLAGNKTSATFSSGGGQTLNFNNSSKFATTNTGIDVTGAITADDLRTDNSQTFYLTTANDFRFRHTGGTERLRIDSSGRVLIGTTTEGQASSDDLTIAGSGNQGMTIRSGSSNAGTIHFSDGTSGTAEYEGAIQYAHSTNYMAFSTNHAERLRITSNGAIQSYYNTNLPVTDSRPILQLGYGVIGDDSSGYNAVTCNAYPVLGDSSWHYIGGSSLGASRYHIGFGDHKWFTASAGTRGNDITWTERLSIASNGQATFTGNKVQIHGGTTARSIDVETTHGSGGEIASFQNNNAGNYGGLVISGGEIDRECRMEAAWGSGFFTYWTNNAERMRIDASGHTFFSQMTSLTASGSNKGINMENSTNYGRMNIHANSSAGNALGISFYNNGANVGTIYYGTSSTAYNTTSDYRLKENATTISDGITRLKSLKPYRFNFKVDPDKTVDGFFAHEVAPIIPEAVTGEKDAEDMQQLDYAKLTPLLTAALQEAITKIETLEAKVASLEGS